MSEGSVFVRGSDGRACATYKDARGKTRYLYAKTKPEVRRRLRQALRDRDDGFIPPSRMSVAALLDEWLDELRNNVSKRTWLNRESLVRVHIRPTIGATQLSKLDPKIVRNLYREKLAEGLSSGTVKRIHVILNQAMRLAVTSKYIPHNPLADVKPPKEAHSEVEVLSPADVRRLLAAASGSRYEAIFVLGATCGLRIGETLSIRVEDIDFDKGTLHIRRTLWRGQVYPPKTKSSRRTIKLPALALDVLKQTQVQADGWLFPTSGGAPIDATSFWRRYWLPVLRKAGLPETLTYHQLRKGTASLLLNQNVPVAVVSKYLGHSNPSTTYRYYAGIFDGTSGMAADGMDEALG